MCHFVWRNKQMNERTNKQTDRQTNRQTDKHASNQGLGTTQQNKNLEQQIGNPTETVRIPKHKQSMAVLLWFRGCLAFLVNERDVRKPRFFQQDHQAKSVATKKSNAKN